MLYLILFFLSLFASATPPAGQPSLPQSDTSFVNLLQLDSSFVLDVKYATTNNFTGQALYDCASCYLREPVAKRLLKAQAILKQKGYKIKLFDCYRPLSIQQQMWEVYPDRRYVADPAKGSMHNRGGAVDLTLCTLDGEEVEMGSPYDHFGRESHPGYKNLPAEVLAHRQLLAATMQQVGLQPINSEWWHFSYRGKNYPLSNFPIPCPETP